MAASSETLQIIISLKDMASQALGKVEKSVQGIGNVSAKVSDKIFSLQNAVAGIAAGALVKGVIDTSSRFEDLSTALKTVTGSADGAQKAMAWITEFTANTPYELDQVAEGFQSLTSYGLDATKNLEVLGDTAAAMNKPLMQAVEMMADAVTGEFERLKEFGVRAKTEGENVTFSWMQAGKQMEVTTKKTGASIEEALQTILKGRFSGAMEDMSKTWSGMMSNLADSWTLFLKSIGDAGAFDYLKTELAGLLQRIGELKESGKLDEWAGRIGEAIKGAVQTLKTMAVTLWNVAQPFTPLLQKAVELSPAIIGIGTAVAGTAVALNTLVPAITATISGIRLLSTAFTSVGAASRAMALGGYVAQIQAASASTGILAASTATLGTALTTAAGAVGAFFAGWKVGELISASDAFGLLPLKVGEYVQIGFGKIDQFVSEAKVKFLELRLLWNEFTGDSAEAESIRKAIEAEKDHQAAIQLTIKDIREKKTEAKDAGSVQAQAAQKVAEIEKNAADQKVETAKSAEEQIKAIQQGNVDAYLSTLKAETDAAKAEYDRRMTEIEIAEARGVMTHNQAVQAKVAANQVWYDATVGKAKAVADEAAAAYGTDSAKFKQVIEAKKAALDQYLAKEKEIAGQIKSLNDQVAQSRMSTEDQLRALKQKSMGEYEAYQDKVRQIEEKITQAQKLSATDTQASIELFKQAQQMASGVSDEVAEGERVVVSQQKAVSTAMKLVEDAQTGIEDAAKKGVDALEQQSQANQKAADETSSSLNEIEQAIVKMGEQVIFIQADGTVAKQEIASVEAEFQKLQDKQINIDVDTSEAEADVKRLAEKVAALNKHAAESIKKTIEFRGKASPERPLMETIQTVDQAIAKMKEETNFQQEAVFNFKGDTGEGKTGASEAIDDLQADAEEVREVISDPISMEIDTSPAKAALRELADEAYREAVAAEKLAYKLGQSISGAHGDLRRLVRQNFKDIKGQAQEATAEYERLKKRMGSGFHDGGPVPRALGGPITASIGRYIRRRHGKLPGVDTGKDYVPVLARGGEWFIRNEAVDHWKRRFGAGFMSAINAPWSNMGRRISDALASASVPMRMAAGGGVGAAAPSFDVGGLKDYGRLDITRDGRGGTMIGKNEVLRWVKDSFMEDKRRGVK